MNVSTFCAEMHLSNSTYYKILRGERVPEKVYLKPLPYLCEFAEREQIDALATDFLFYLSSHSRVILSTIPCYPESPFPCLPDPHSLLS